MLSMSEEQYIHHFRSENIMYTTPRNGRNKPHQAKQDVRHTRKYQYIRHIRRPNVLYATSGNTKSTPHQDIQYLSFIRKRYLCLTKNINATADDDTIYCTPHQEIEKVRHIRKYRMYAISGNVMYNCRTIYTPLQERQCNEHHIRKCKKQATSGKTDSAT